MKYMVMECYLSYAIVMDEQGKVLKVANKNYNVGDIVENVFEMKEKERLLQSPMKIMTPILVLAAAVVLMITTIPLFNPSFATITIDINPKLALQVREDSTVKKIKPLNEDAKALIKDYNYKEKTVETVTEELVELAMIQGFLKEGGSINLIFDSKNQKWIIDKSESMKNNLVQDMSNTLKISFTITNVKSHKVDIIDPVDNKVDKDIKDESKPNTNKPSKPKNPGKTPDTDYQDDDTDYDDTDYDTSTYDDTDYDDSEYDESDFDDTDYDD